MDANLTYGFFVSVKAWDFANNSNHLGVSIRFLSVKQFLLIFFMLSFVFGAIFLLSEDLFPGILNRFFFP